MGAPQLVLPNGDHMHCPDRPVHGQEDADSASAASDTTSFYDAFDASSVATRDDLDHWEDPLEDHRAQQVRSAHACSA